MTDYGTCTGIVGGDLEELEALIATPQRSFAVPLEAAAAIPQMSRPYQGVKVVTQHFGSRHYGADIGIPTGTRLYACHGGQVVTARADTTGYGFVIAIKNDALGVYTVYGHLNGMGGIVVRTGEWVTERQHIGYSDNTGNSTGPHLHLELRVRPYGYPGSCVDPLPHMSVWTDAPPPPTPPPTPTGNQWRTLKRVSVYAAPSIGAQVVDHLASGAIVAATVAAESDPLRDWLKLGQYRYIMSRNKGKTLAVKA